MTGYLTYPNLDPVLFAIGPFAIRWYALAYIAGFILGWRMILLVARHHQPAIKPVHVEGFLLWAVLGTILGGRFGYALFYQFDAVLANPLWILKIWQGGMSFHGGMAGVALAIFLFARRNGLTVFALADLVALVAPIGLFFGRLANFVNGELWGRVTEQPWGMVFPGAGPLPRHPSQLYEAALEGALLFAFLQLMAWRTRVLARPGAITALFLFSYGSIRFFVEFVREPDPQLGLIWGSGISMGQLLSVPMIVAGALILRWSILRVTNP